MSILNQLKDYRVVKVSLPLKDGQQQSLDGVARVTTSPQFEVTFLPDQLQAERLNLEDFCLVIFDVAGENKSVKAKIDSIPATDKLLLEMVDSFSYAQKREYFRVDAELSVSYWNIDAEHPTAKSVQTPVNISGGGLRIPVSEVVKEGARLGLEIVIDFPQPAVIECIGDVVVTYSVGNVRQVALSFSDIEEEDQDAIVAYCLAEQRKQLRLKVQVLGSSGS
ncbi:MAG: PilZ domain-containing protein [Thermodesulfobacteriota bacterium]|nr:PilZ domain-containing protein [Thermodesulfobacteriota bacterium]